MGPRADRRIGLVRTIYRILTAGLVVLPCGLVASAGTTDHLGKSYHWKPAGISADIQALVPAGAKNAVFEIGEFQGAARIAAGRPGPPGDPVTPAQCEALASSLRSLARAFPSEKFPFSVRDWRTLSFSLWALDRLHDRPLTLGDLNRLIQDRVAMQELKAMTENEKSTLTSTSLRVANEVAPGSVVFIPISIPADDGPPHRYVLMGCAWDSGPENEVSGAANEPGFLSLFASFWKPAPSHRMMQVERYELPAPGRPDPAALPWVNFARQFRRALWAYGTTSKDAPEGLNDLDRVFGPRNPAAWTPDFVRLINEFYFPQFERMLAEERAKAPYYERLSRLPKEYQWALYSVTVSARRESGSLARCEMVSSALNEWERRRNAVAPGRPELLVEDLFQRGYLLWRLDGLKPLSPEEESSIGKDGQSPFEALESIGPDHYFATIVETHDYVQIRFWCSYRAPRSGSPQVLNNWGLDGKGSWLLRPGGTKGPDGAFPIVHSQLPFHFPLWQLANGLRGHYLEKGEPAASRDDLARVFGAESSAWGNPEFTRMADHVIASYLLAVNLS